MEDATLPDPNPVEVLLTSEGGAANAALLGFRRKSAAKVRTIFGMTKQLTIKNNTSYENEDTWAAGGTVQEVTPASIPTTEVQGYHMELVSGL